MEGEWKYRCILGLGLLALPVAGCAQFPWSTPWGGIFSRPSLPAADADRAAAERLKENEALLRATLSHEGWQPRFLGPSVLDVSVITLRDRVPPRFDLRWSFASEAVEKPANLATPSTPVLSSPPEDAHWFLSLKIEGEPKSSDDPGTLTVSSEEAAVLDPIRWEAALGATRALLAAEERAGINAALLLSRLRPEISSEFAAALEGTVRQKLRWKSSSDGTAQAASLSLQCAAAEAWCQVLAAQDGPVESRMLPVGHLLQDPGLPLELKATLWRGTAALIEPDRIPGLADAVASAETDILLRRAAIETCLIHALAHAATAPIRSGRPERQTAWPPRIEQCRWDRDALVRRTYCRWLVAIASPDLGLVARGQMQDTDVNVQDDALLSLGLSSDPAVAKLLTDLFHHGDEHQRTCALRSLAIKSEDVLPLALRDPAAPIRKQAVHELRRYPSLPNAVALRPLTLDRNIEVQRELAATLREWPRDLSIPLLLDMLTGSTGIARKEALASLGHHLGFEPSFPVEAPETERRAAIRKLIADQGLSAQLILPVASETVDSRVTGNTVFPRRPVPQWTAPEWNAELTKLLATEPGSSGREDTLVPILQAAAADPAGIIEVTFTRSPADQTWICENLLSRVDPAFAALRDLQARDIQTRRDAARRLKLAAADRSLSPLIMQRLYPQLELEQDRLVWQDVMAAILPDEGAAAGRIVQLSLNHAWPDIRLLGCRYLQHHPRPDRVLWIAPLVDDRDRSVQLAAIEAAGLCGSPLMLDGLPSGDGRRIGALRPLVHSQDSELRNAALLALCRLGDEQACEELVRQTFDPNPPIRLKAITAMGDSGQGRFVDPLITLAWTEQSDHVRSEALRSLARLVPADSRPEALQGTAAHLLTPRQAVEHWVQWQRRPTAPRLN